MNLHQYNAKFLESQANHYYNTDIPVVIFVRLKIMVLNEYISNKLENLRKEKKLGVYTLCNRAAISYETYRSIRKNRNKDIYLRTILILLRTLEVTPQEFFSDPMFQSEELDIDFK